MATGILCFLVYIGILFVVAIGLLVRFARLKNVVPRTDGKPYNIKLLLELKKRVYFYTAFAFILWHLMLLPLLLFVADSCIFRNTIPLSLPALLLGIAGLFLLIDVLFLLFWEVRLHRELGPNVLWRYLLPTILIHWVFFPPLYYLRITDNILNANQSSDSNKEAGNENSTNKSRSFRAFSSMLIIYLLACLVPMIPFYFLYCRSVPLTISAQTPMLTTSMPPDGQQVNDYKWLVSKYPADYRTDRNGFRLLLQRVNPFDVVAYENRPDQVPKIYSSVGLHYDELRPRLKKLVPLVKYDLLKENDCIYKRFFQKRFPAPTFSALNERWTMEIPWLRDPPFDVRFNFKGQLVDSKTPLSPVETALVQFYEYKHVKNILGIQHGDIPESLSDEDYLLFAEEAVKTNGELLDLMAECLQKELFFIPYCDNSESEAADSSTVVTQILLNDLYAPHIQCREWARQFQLRAYYRYTKGDKEGAVDDLVTLYRLTNHLFSMPNNCFIIDYYTGISVAKGHCLPYEKNSHSLFTRAQWERLKREIDRFPAMEQVMHRAMEFHKHCIFGDLQKYAILPDPCELLYQIYPGDYIETLVYSDEIMYVRRRVKEFSLLGIDWNIAATQFLKLVQEEKNNIGCKKQKNPHENYCFLSPSRTVRSKEVGYLLFENNPMLDWRRYSLFQNCWNMMKITMALQIYKAEHGTFPPACTIDSSGKPLHSWRVLLLPQLGEKELFQKIRLNKPWDSDYNRQFHKVDIPAFNNRCFSEDEQSSSESGETIYSVIVGPNTLFNESGAGIDPVQWYRERKISTPVVILARRTQPICWMKPDDELKEPNEWPTAGEIQEEEQKERFFEQMGMVSNESPFGFSNGTVQQITLKDVLIAPPADKKGNVSTITKQEEGSNTGQEIDKLIKQLVEAELYEWKYPYKIRKKEPQLFRQLLTGQPENVDIQRATMEKKDKEE